MAFVGDTDDGAPAAATPAPLGFAQPRQQPVAQPPVTSMGQGLANLGSAAFDGLADRNRRQAVAQTLMGGQALALSPSDQAVASALQNPPALGPSPVDLVTPIRTALGLSPLASSIAPPAASPPLDDDEDAPADWR